MGTTFGHPTGALWRTSELVRRFLEERLVRLDGRLMFRGDIDIEEDRVDWALGCAGTTVDTELRVDEELHAREALTPLCRVYPSNLFDVDGPMDAVHWADVNARGVADSVADIGDDRGHSQVSCPT